MTRKVWYDAEPFPWEHALSVWAGCASLGILVGLLFVVLVR